MKSKKVQAGSAEKSALQLGGQQVRMGNALKDRLDGRIDAMTSRDDSVIQRAKANAGVQSTMAQTLSNTTDPAARSAAIIGGNQALTEANTSATAMAESNQRDRMNSAIKLRFGAQDGVASSLLSSASAQNNAAATLAQAKMQNQAATMGAVGNAIGTYSKAKQDTDYANKLSLMTAETQRSQNPSSPVSYLTQNVFGKTKQNTLAGGG
jgi:hypothetical protein